MVRGLALTPHPKAIRISLAFKTAPSCSGGSQDVRFGNNVAEVAVFWARSLSLGWELVAKQNCLIVDLVPNCQAWRKSTSAILRMILSWCRLSAQEHQLDSPSYSLPLNIGRNLPNTRQEAQNVGDGRQPYISLSCGLTWIMHETREAHAYLGGSVGLLWCPWGCEMTYE